MLRETRAPVVPVLPGTQYDKRFFWCCWYIDHYLSGFYRCARTGSRAFSGLLADMHCISFLERVVATRQVKRTLRSFVRADSHREIGKRVAFATDLKLLAHAEWRPLDDDGFCSKDSFQGP